MVAQRLQWLVIKCNHHFMSPSQPAAQHWPIWPCKIHQNAPKIILLWTPLVFWSLWSDSPKSWSCYMLQGYLAICLFSLSCARFGLDGDQGTWAGPEWSWKAVLWGEQGQHKCNINIVFNLLRVALWIGWNCFLQICSQSILQWQWTTNHLYETALTFHKGPLWLKCARAAQTFSEEQCESKLRLPPPARTVSLWSARGQPAFEIVH